MCGRYLLIASCEDIADLFGVETPGDFPPRYNIAPSQPVLIIRNSETRRREAALVQWGFLPSWAKFENGRPKVAPMINARSETVAEKASFKSAWRRRRCLIPASGFYEWCGQAGARQPYWIRPADSAAFGFAAIWEILLTPDGSEIETVAILTTGAGPGLRDIHDREPVVVDPNFYEEWLNADERDLDRVTATLRARPGGFWRADPVSTDVNSPANDGARLIAPLGGPIIKPDLFA